MRLWKTYSVVVWSSVIMIVLLSLTGCLGGKFPELKGETGYLVLSIEVPASLRQEVSTQSILDLVKLKWLTVTCTDGKKTEVQQIEFKGNDTINVPFQLAVGVWNVQVELIDNEGYIVAAGTGTGEVSFGETTEVTVPVDVSPGKLELRVRTPDNDQIASGKVTLLGFVSGVQDITETFDATAKQHVWLTFNEIQARIWPVVVELFDSKGLALYDGREAISVLPGRTTQAEVEFLAPGVLQLSLIWNLPPERPQNVTAVWSNTTDTITIMWDPVPGAEGYLVTRSTTLGEKPIWLNTTPILDTSIVDDTIVSGMTYLYRVASYYENGLSSRFSAEVTVTSAFIPGEEVHFDIEGVSWTMVHAPAASFPVENDDKTEVVEKGFLVGQTEVTYELWYIVRQWALQNEYTFANWGKEGSHGSHGNPPTSKGNEPVTRVSWRDAIVWSNALSEMLGYQPVYTYQGSVIRDSRDSNATACDNAEQEDADGFRLPISNEWELAARYKGNDSSHGAIARGGLYWTPHNYSSGATGDDLEAIEEVAWIDSNSGSTKNVGLKQANALGLYDMSGNVKELMFRSAKSSAGRAAIRGGSFNGHTPASVSVVHSIGSDGGYDHIGFRLAKTQY